jgi:Ca2+-binding RTX toxin-like protein
VTAAPRSTRRRRVAAALAAVAAIGAVAFGAFQSTVPPDGTSVLGATKKPQPPIIDAGCDVDGVTVDYGAAFRTSPGDPQYRVVRAEVGNVAPTCAGATVSVRLLEGTTTLATATGTAGTPIVGLDFTDAPPARQVNGVAVEIVGGDVPVPERCASMTFDRFTVLTAGNDPHAGSKDRDLTYGLEGNDTLRGDNQHDCLDGQAGNDQLLGENHDDVLVGGEGDDVLTGGGGDDTLDGGPGFDRCIGGPGKNTTVDCEAFQ